MKFYSLAFLAMTISFGAFAGHDPYEAPKHECPSPCPSPCPEVPACPACPEVHTHPSPCELSHGHVGQANGSKYLYNAGNIGTRGVVTPLNLVTSSANIGTIGLVFSPVDHLALGLGFGLGYNAGTEHFDWSLNPSVEYMVVDACPFAMGPGVDATVSFLDGDYLGTDLFVGWNFWYTPFNAPLSIGTSLGATVAIPNGGDVDVRVGTPGLKLLYMFN